MSALPVRLLFAFAIALSAQFAHAASADEDFRRAAKLHKAGETAQAVAIWQRWAEQGQADAAYNLAIIHHYGDGVALDYAKAMAWYRQAAEKGDKPSQFQIGLMYQNGEGVEANQEEAHRWFTQHLQHHLHHQHDPKMVAWRQQALALIDERDRREQAALARQNGQRILAELKQRALPQAPLSAERLAANQTH
ncbi:MAG: sel1 repeat family protein [Rhodocyclales bacterium GT-UBC]|nr:MAG: sel1 repeat family protein [Rhodocyclales bacterium GT-UBC]